MDTHINPDDVYIHTRTKVSYIIVGTGLMKLGEHQVWTDSVVYRNPSKNPSVLFTRDSENFLKNFTKV